MEATSNTITLSKATHLNWDDVYMLKGRLLTLIDATFTDPQQRKAHKDIVWQTLSEWARDCDQRAGGEGDQGKTKYIEFTNGGSIGPLGSGASIEVGEKPA